MNINYKNTKIKYTSMVYEPAEDSFLLAEAALDEIKGSERILEVGCGSGIISAIIKNNTKCKNHRDRYKSLCCSMHKR